MKFTVEVEDFYLEEEDLHSGLKSYVKNAVLNEIQKSIKDKIEKQITMEVKDTVEKTMYAMITILIKEVIGTEKIRSRWGSEVITLKESVIEAFKNTSAIRDLDKIIANVATLHATEVKSRYDLLFATGIVKKMQENGLLKDDIAKILLEQKIV